MHVAHAILTLKAQRQTHDDSTYLKNNHANLAGRPERADTPLRLKVNFFEWALDEFIANLRDISLERGALNSISKL